MHGLRSFGPMECSAALQRLPSPISAKHSSLENLELGRLQDLHTELGVDCIFSTPMSFAWIVARAGGNFASDANA